MSPTLNYTTTIAAQKTVAEMHQALVKYRASAIATRYSEGGKPSGITFVIDTPHGPRTFSLAVDTAGMFRSLSASARRREIPARYASAEQAERVAWRTAKMWLEANLAMVDAELATFDQIMLPYLHVNGEVTLYEAFREREQAAIEASPA